MAAETNEALVRRFFAAVFDAAGDLSLMDDLYVPDNRSPTREQLREAVRVYHTAFPDWHTSIVSLVVADDTVIVCWIGRGPHAGVTMGMSAAELVPQRSGGGSALRSLRDIAPTGRLVEVEGASLFRIDAGRIVSQWMLLDLAYLLQELGAVPVPIFGSRALG